MYPAHTGAFMIRRDDLFFLGFRIAMLWLQNTTPTAVFAPILLAATTIMTILDNILTAAMTTPILHRFGYYLSGLPLIT
jgi:hypothetical protein